MKKKYETPEVEVTKFADSDSDVIRTSGGGYDVIQEDILWEEYSNELQ